METVMHVFVCMSSVHTHTHGRNSIHLWWNGIFENDSIRQKVWPTKNQERMHVIAYCSQFFASGRHTHTHKYVRWKQIFCRLTTRSYVWQIYTYVIILMPNVVWIWHSLNMSLILNLCPMISYLISLIILFYLLRFSH